ncbi:MAG: type II toxin-antitoxin system HicB family antitoxin, partial [Patescibacteria group bacterium]
MKTNILNYRVVIEQDEDGVYVASVPTLQGCYTEGSTYEEVIKNIKDVIKLHIKAREISEVDDSLTEFIGIKNISFP